MAKHPLENIALRTLDSGILGILSITFRDMGSMQFSVQEWTLQKCL